MKVVILTDFSESAFKAVDFVYRHFKTDQINVKLLHCVTQPVSSAGILMRLEDLMKIDAQKNMLELTNQVQKTYHKSPDTTVLLGQLKDVIKQLAASEGIDLIIMGTKGETNLQSRLMGSITESVIRTSSIPVLAIPESWYSEDLHSLTVTTAEKELESKLFLTHFIENLRISTPSFNVLTVTKSDHIGLLPRSMDLGGVSFNVHTIENEDVVDGINSYMESNKIDILCVYHRHNSTLDYLFNMSVTKTICADTEVPILAIPAHR
jgi:nucleotide-binding universal stress UspA family protein